MKSQIDALRQLSHELLYLGMVNPFMQIVFVN